MYNNLYNNPYQQMNYGNVSYNQQPLRNSYTGARFEIIQVSGRNGADAFQMPPNSSILLLDETAPIVWLKKTDGAGYATLEPFDVVPHKSAQQIQQNDMKLLEERITKLEEIINDQLSKSNVESSQPVRRITATNKES